MLYNLMRHQLFCFIVVENIEFDVHLQKSMLEAVYMNDGRILQSSYFGAVFLMIRRILVTAGLQKLHKKKVSQ
ncbi:hypothetical protein I7I50_09534 [Histoplasma capsulatum G186AR]|uniref:Uncharacterized protein n=1 Tax=Ajellomyces capsulatus TaxID=5037 RepID=A0A8H7YSJ2_AJECA|nr:hypothetical protein I7I52_07055 [Histoplasma capsulatum]QSS74394.1 hypothetical protein I7I50_09534 [Histoplasma capsulatum G186AR]